MNLNLVEQTRNYNSFNSFNQDIEELNLQNSIEGQFLLAFRKYAAGDGNQISNEEIEKRAEMLINAIEKIEKVVYQDYSNYSPERCCNGGDYGFWTNYKFVGNHVWEISHNTTADFLFCPNCGQFYQYGDYHRADCQSYSISTAELATMLLTQQYDEETKIGFQVPNLWLLKPQHIRLQEAARRYYDKKEGQLTFGLCRLLKIAGINLAIKIKADWKKYEITPSQAKKANEIMELNQNKLRYNYIYYSPFSGSIQLPDYEQWDISINQAVKLENFLKERGNQYIDTFWKAKNVFKNIAEKRLEDPIMNTEGLFPVLSFSNYSKVVVLNLN